MGKYKLTLLVAAVLFALTPVAATVYAQNSDGASGSMMGRGMMGRGMMGGGMMGSRNGMMGHCGGMMRGDRGGGRPNEQWRDTPER